MTTIYSAERVYGNLLKMLKCREMRPIGSDYPTAAEMTKALAESEHFAVYATRAKSETREETTAVVILIQHGSEYTTTVGRFKSLCMTIKPVQGNLNIIFCASNVITPHISKEIDRIKVEGLGEAARQVTADKLRVEYYQHKDFALDKTHHHMVSPHRIVPLREVEAFCKTYSTSACAFPRILDDDAQVIFAGIVPGQVVEIVRLSEVSAENVNWRICMPASSQKK